MKLEGFYVQFSSRIDQAQNARLHALHRQLAARLAPGVTDLCPAYTSLFVEYDADTTTAPAMRAWVTRALATLDTHPLPPREVEIPVRYDGEDLPWVAQQTGLSEADVIRTHAGGAYHVFAIGFTPGFPFMGELPEVLRLPRRATPRGRVPVSALAIANAQTCIYALPSPGGWHLLGTALTTVYDPNRATPFLLSAGDTVRFRPAEGEAPSVPDIRPLWPEDPHRPTMRVEQPGLLDLLVDAGRHHQGHHGMARGGALDARAARFANGLVANPPGTPLLELTLQGPTLTALRDVVAGVAGFGMRALVNGREAPAQTSFRLRAGDTLRFTSTREGARAYLALSGGLDTWPFLGSSSTDLIGRIGRPLAAGDVLGAAGAGRARPGFTSPLLTLPSAVTLRLQPGPQASRDALRALTQAPFTVAGADRMGVRLDGPPVPGGELISEGTPLGAVQVTPAGQPILLLGDQGRVGGYHKPAVLDPRDLPLAAQLRPGQRVRFQADLGGNPEVWRRRWFLPAG